ncbi:NADP-dependent malic enzyme [Aquibaculum arenosum]|uniref:NADP-dependent malic enzyme n=1 Tax=Aquibaculum arenosum TaxID=3032591 RepID=A0ABT5YR37_9PROT|nr:NADP-dependent malic enzyme [Fodinicurvata sp. CAU 1616]MDF2097278.1 NADP-dependent malic enzyme [Fodinicurvata sp. CAU 1616]
MVDDTFAAAALTYHRTPVPGKLEVVATKPLGNQRDLALAYSPGVAAACRAIVEDPAEASTLTARANLVGVVTNGTAVLGLGAIGPLASKPVMEGKAVLFKKFAGIDVFDIELAELDPERLIEIVGALEPTFGGINLEDIKAPECFIVERELRKRMNIPVFHDDQHGTAIIVNAAIYNALHLVDKKLEDVKVVCSGAGAAAIACLDLLVEQGARRENIFVSDIEGVVYAGRETLMDPWKARYAQETKARSLGEVIEDADVFLGLSAPNVLKAEMVARMARDPVILALANPEPEILPEEARAARPDAIIATGRSDYPNQVNNVLCFPFIFRGALDVGATEINEEMKIACVRALAELARSEVSEVVIQAYGGESAPFGREYLIPRPFDPRLILQIAPAVAEAAMKSGVATRPIKDLGAYRQQLNEFVFRSGLAMKPVFEQAKADPQRVFFAEGEAERVLRAVQAVVDEGLARPIICGRPKVVEDRIERLGLRIRIDEDFELVNPLSDPRYNDYWRLYHRLMERNGVSPDRARTVVRTDATVIGALAVRRGDADALICGVEGRYRDHLRHIENIIGKAGGVHDYSALSLLITAKGTFFIADTYVSDNPTAQELVEMTVYAAEAVQRFGITPKIALLSHSSFGSHQDSTAGKMREAVRMLHESRPDLEVEGEMHADAALSEDIRSRIFPNSRLKGAANLLIMPTLDAANISFNLLKVLGEGLSVGPLLLGTACPAHIATPSITARGVINLCAIAAVDARSRTECHPLPDLAPGADSA